MSGEVVVKEEEQINEPYCTSSALDQGLLKCGGVFLCLVAEDFVFLCGFCEENTSCKFTVFDEFTNHIKENHIMLLKNDSAKCLNDIDEKESIHEQTWDELMESLHSDLEAEDDDDKESLKPLMELNKDDNQKMQQPKLFVLQWSENQISQLINLYREQECLWNVNSGLFHDNKLKTAAYSQIVQQFNVLNPNVLKDISSAQTAIKELHEFYDDFEKGQKQKTPFSSNSPKHKIYEKLHFLKNVSTLTSIQIDDEITTAEHSSEDLVKCDTCGFRFKYKNLEMHNQLHGDPLYECDDCNMKFLSKQRLYSHRRKHTDRFTGKVSCVLCKKLFANKYTLSVHEKCVHKIS